MTIVAAIFVIFCLAHLHDVSANIKVLHKSVVHLDKTVAFSPESYLTGYLTYALCDKNPLANPVKCTVYQEKKPYSDETYSCDITLKRVENHREYKPKIEVYPFGKNYAAVVLLETAYVPSSSLKFTTVQFDNCKISETELDRKDATFLNFGKIVGHSDSYDVFFKDQKNSCLGKTCKATIDINGKLANKPGPSVENIVRSDGIIRPIVALEDPSSASAYFYFKEDGKELAYTLVKRDGTEKVFTKQLTGPQASIAKSTTNQLIGVCYAANKEYKCNQYDYEGNPKLESTISKNNDHFYMIDMYNLPSGGFYTASRQCKDEPLYLIERIDSNGKKTGSIEVQGLKGYSCSEYNQFPLFYNNENNETCVSVIATDTLDAPGPKEGKGHIHLTSNCFTDADFK